MIPPSIPAVLVALGRAVELDGTDWEWTWTVRDNWLLTSIPSGRSLYLFKRPNERVDIYPNSQVFKQGKRLYGRFNHRDFDKSLRGRVVELKQRAGRANHVVYASDKFGKMEEYIHTFEKQPIIWTDKPDKPRVIALTGGAIRITKRGIVG